MKLLKGAAVVSSISLVAAFIVFCGAAILLPSTKSGRVFHPKEELEADSGAPVAPAPAATEPSTTQPQGETR